jgi:hypothetical protein
MKLRWQFRLVLWPVTLDPGIISLKFGSHSYFFLFNSHQISKQTLIILFWKFKIWSSRVFWWIFCHGWILWRFYVIVHFLTSIIRKVIQHLHKIWHWEMDHTIKHHDIDHMVNFLSQAICEPIHFNYYPGIIGFQGPGWLNELGTCSWIT